MRVLGAPLRKVGDRVRAVGGEAVARRQQPLDAHRPARVDPARRDPDLGAEPEAEAVGEAAWERGRRRASEELRAPQNCAPQNCDRRRIARRAGGRRTRAVVKHVGGVDAAYGATQAAILQANLTGLSSVPHPQLSHASICPHCRGSLANCPVAITADGVPYHETCWTASGRAGDATPAWRQQWPALAQVKSFAGIDVPIAGVGVNIFPAQFFSSLAVLR